jgi:hypothetical protein
VRGSTRRCLCEGERRQRSCESDGRRLINVMTIDVAGDVPQAARTIVNREKLRHLGPLADIGPRPG